MSVFTKILIVSAGVLFLADARAAEDSSLVIVDAAGKEQKLKSWKFLTGTRRLGWLEPTAPGRGKDKEAKDAGPDTSRPPRLPPPPSGPEALAFREEHSTDFENGILTLVPLDRIRRIEYDNEQETVTVHVAGKGEDIVLTGTTKFVGTNKLTIEAEVNLGDLGVAEKKFLGGVRKGGIRAVRFPSPKAPAAVPAGRPAAITDTDKDKTIHAVTDLQPLYRLADGSERRVSALFFKKTLRVDVGKMRGLQLSKGEQGEIDCQLSLKNGDEHTLTLLRTVSLDGRPAALQGLVGIVPAGYQEFPIHTVAEVRFDGAKDDDKKMP
jgi:hypothetical protein